MNQPAKSANLFFYLLTAVTIYGSWHWPGSDIGAYLSVLSAILLSYLTTSGRIISAKKSYLCGVIVNTAGFYWLKNTVELFGGFSALLSVPIFIFFVLVSSLQFLAFSWIFNNLPLSLKLLRLPLAWISAEFLCPRIFPWELATPLIALPVTAQIADIAGSYLLSVILLLCSSILLSVFNNPSMKQRSIHAATLASIITVWFYYGHLRQSEFSMPEGSSLDIAVIQANVDVVQRGNIATITQNKKRYLELSSKISPAPDLIVWPEAVMQEWIHTATRSIDQDPRLPFYGPQSSLLTGALTFETQEVFFNSALLIDKNGFIPPPYHKRILMPYGEYMPFSSVFPWLNSINANLALFTAGSDMKLFELPVGSDSNNKIKIAPLICYEDLIPRLARTATKMGAQILFNLTNDAWFGDSAAAEHHNMIARFRAIENRRFLVRSTNNGKTAVINPLGQVVASIPEKSEGILQIQVAATNRISLFTSFLGPWLWWTVCLLTVLFSVRSCCRRS